MMVLAPFFSFSVCWVGLRRPSRGEETTVTWAFVFAVGGAGATASGDKNDAASNAVAYMTRRGEDNDVDVVVFLRRVEDRDALRFFGCDDG